MIGQVRSATRNQTCQTRAEVFLRNTVKIASLPPPRRGVWSTFAVAAFLTPILAVLVEAFVR